MWVDAAVIGIDGARCGVRVDLEVGAESGDLILQGLQNTGGDVHWDAETGGRGEESWREVEFGEPRSSVSQSTVTRRCWLPSRQATNSSIAGVSTLLVICRHPVMFENSNWAKKLGGGSFIEPQNASEAGSTMDLFRFRTLSRCRFNQIVV